ncbi:MAG: hypothetical protein ACT4OY_07685 [Alphaproteobacteria bacterium]
MPVDNFSKGLVIPGEGYKISRRFNKKDRDKMSISGIKIFNLLANTEEKPGGYDIDPDDIDDLLNDALGGYMRTPH